MTINIEDTKDLVRTLVDICLKLNDKLELSMDIKKVSDCFMGGQIDGTGQPHKDGSYFLLVCDAMGTDNNRHKFSLSKGQLEQLRDGIDAALKEHEASQ